MSCVARNLYSGFPVKSDTNQAVQPLKMPIGLEFQVKEEEGLYYLCSENIGADLLHGNHTAYLRLRFFLCKKQVFS